jgi:adenine phosphoribosyltransferase
MDRAGKAALQLRAVRLLGVLKQNRTYEELAELTGLPAGDLNRYVNGHVLPGVERARRVVDGVGYQRLAAELDDRLRFDEEGYVDNTGAVFDQPFLELVAPVAADRLDVDPPDAVLTAATDGLTLGAALAGHFGARVAYAKKSKETAVEEFLEARTRLPNGTELTYYLPADALSAGDRVVVVDDVVRSGETQTMLLDIAREAGAEVTGVFTLVAVGTEGLEAVRAATDAPVAALRRYD